MSAAAASPAPALPPPSKSHRGWVWTLIVLAAIIALLSSLTIFVKRQALNSQAFSETSVRMLQDKQVRDALSVYMTDQLFSNIDVKTQLEELLPKSTKSLAGPASGLLRQFAPRAASDILAQPAVQNVWQEVNYRAHQRFMAIINGKSSGTVQTEQGEVVLDLHPLVQQLADRLGLGGQIAPDAGRLVIFKSDQLKLVQNSVKAIKVLSVFLVALVLILYAVAIRLAVGWRRVALRAIGWSLAIVGVLLLVVRQVAGNQIVGSLVHAQSEKTAARHAWLIGSTLLSDLAWTIIFYGVAVVIAAWLGGSTRPATAIRRWLAPEFRERLGFVIAGVTILFLLLILWGPTPATRQWWGILFFAALVGLGFWMLQRETLQEFPDGGTATERLDLRASWNRLRGGSKGGGSEPPPA
jgi:hypothetical protein